MSKRIVIRVNRGFVHSGPTEFNMDQKIHAYNKALCSMCIEYRQTPNINQHEVQWQCMRFEGKKKRLTYFIYLSCCSARSFADDLASKKR